MGNFFLFNVPLLELIGNLVGPDLYNFQYIHNNVWDNTAYSSIEKMYFPLIASNGIKSIFILELRMSVRKMPILFFSKMNNKLNNIFISIPS